VRKSIIWLGLGLVLGSFLISTAYAGQSLNSDKVPVQVGSSTLMVTKHISDLMASSSIDVNTANVVGSNEKIVEKLDTIILILRKIQYSK